MREITIQMPDEFTDFWESEEVFAKRMLFLGVLDLLRIRKISMGKAAQILGIDPLEIRDLARQYNIASLNCSIEDMEKESAIWEKIKKGMR